MKRLVFVATLAGLLGTGVAFAQSGQSTAGGHTAPKPQPASGPALTAPEGQVALGSVTLGRSVKADGKELRAGTYQLRLTADAAAPDAKGATAGLERWVEFLQGGQVKGREVVSIIPQSEIANVQKDAPPGANSAKVEMLKGGDYLRVWIRRGTNHYLLHLPV
ncbi:MAG: hypothetical protein IT176_06885 [Acidobacteria bacterium]|nr:hypothetical protein [Acidobacteriota bacterium]